MSDLTFDEFTRARCAENPAWGFPGYAKTLASEYERYLASPNEFIPMSLASDPNVAHLENRTPAAPRAGDLAGTRSNAQSPQPDAPALSMVFYGLAALSLLAGVFLAEMYYPAHAGSVRTLPPEAYTWSIIWVSAGAVQAALFAAVGQALRYLNTIAINTARDS